MDQQAAASGKSETSAWLVVATLSLLIFATVPLARAAQRFVTELGGRELFLFGVLTVLAAALLGTIWVARRRRLPARFIWVWTAVAIGYMAAAWSLRRAPEEAVHLLEYGALGIAAHRALRFRVGDAWIHLAAALVGAAVGLLDEGIQWLTPSRHWDLRDLGINAASAAGVQFGLAFATQRARAVATGNGRRVAAAIALGTGTLLAASLLNTPPVIARISKHIPLLHPVRDRGDLMVEYGHALPDIGHGLFRSRLTETELRKQDRRRAEEAGALLRAHGANDEYDAFLARFNPITDPFLHELRVHWFRRDRYLETARMHIDEGDRPWARKDFTVAHRENVFLESQYPLTSAAAGLRLDEATAALLEREQRREVDYESP